MKLQWTLLCSLALFGASCVAPSATVALRGHRLSLDGDVAASSSGGSPDSIELEDLGLDDDDDIVAPRVDLDFAVFMLTVDALNSSYSGSGTLTADFDLDDLSVNVGEDVDMDVDFDLYRAIATWDLVPTKYFDAGIGFGINYADVALDVTATSGASAGQSQSERLQAPFPVLAAQVRSEIGPVRLGVIGSGLDFSYDDVDVTFFDVEGSAAFTLIDGPGPTPNAEIILGYRWISLDMELDDDDDVVEADLELTGPYIALSVHF